MYLEIGIGGHSLKRTDNIKRARSCVHHLCLSAVPETNVHSMSNENDKSRKCSFERCEFGLVYQ